MSRPLASRLAAQSLFRASPSTIKVVIPAFGARALSQSSRLQDDSKTAKPQSQALLENLYGKPAASPTQSSLNSMSNLSESAVFRALGASTIDTNVLSTGKAPVKTTREDEHEPWHLHVFAHKHNTHVTFTRPSREPVISLSCGNIGYRKARRGTFDSGYSLVKYVIERLIHNGVPPKVRRLEVTLRGFGQGREAALKVLMSPEGRVLREKIVRVSDSTRIKFGGTRSRAKRRL